MFDVMGKPFFSALARAASEHLGADDPCRQALARAAESPEPSAVEAAQTLLAALPDDRRDRVLASAHAALRQGLPLAPTSHATPERSRMH